MPERSGAGIGVTRDKRRSKDRRRPYDVFVDGEKRAEVGRGRRTEVAVPPGRHGLGVSFDFEDSRQWSVVLAEGEVIQFLCRSRGKTPSGAHIDLYLADPRDQRAQVVPSRDAGPRDMAVKQRAVTRGGDVLTVWAHRSGYLRSLVPNADATDDDGALVILAFSIVVLPVLGLLRWVRHHLLFKGGWSVGVVRDRRLLWPRKVRLERYPDEAQARARAAQVLAEVESWP